MSDVFLARQPIFDRNLAVVGYELLFRGGATDRALVDDADSATATVVLNAFTELGLERVVGGRTAWLNVDRDFLVRKLAFTIPPTLVGLEIIEDQIIDGQLVGAVSELKRFGYRLALDDFSSTRNSDRLLRLADVVKLDIRALGRDQFRREVDTAKHHRLAIVAEKVETREEQAFCMALGCDFFQGYFFCKPELLHERAIAPNRLSLLQLLGRLHDPSIQLSDLEQVIARDVTLSYRLLRYINSAFFGLRCQVDSIGQALALLGIQNVRRWATLTVFAGVDDKPAELTTTALVRARFCERAAALLGVSTPPQLFTVGLFSVVDALMDAPLAELVGELPFADGVRHAIVDRSGEMGRLLECALALERGDFACAHSICSGANDVYIEALEWADRATHALATAEPLALAA